MELNPIPQKEDSEILEVAVQQHRDVQSQKETRMSCCYGFMVFLGLAISLVTLTMMVIYAGVWSQQSLYGNENYTTFIRLLLLTRPFPSFRRSFDSSDRRRNWGWQAFVWRRDPSFASVGKQARLPRHKKVSKGSEKPFEVHSWHRSLFSLFCFCSPTPL